jgi:hypothetical protein
VTTGLSTRLWGVNPLLLFSSIISLRISWAVQRAGARTTQADGNIEPIHDEPKQGGR